ncbi:hypothetical protein U1Q18_000586 [Sarracenia purpurea var. burkii]
MGLITLEDLKDVKINPTDSVFECLVKIAEFAFELFNKEKSMEDNPDEKKKKMMMKTQPIDLHEPTPSAQREKLVRQRSMIIREEVKREISARIEELFKNPNNAGALNISKGERMTREKSLKKSAVYPVENLPKKERLKKENDLMRPVIEEKTKKNYRRPRSESDEEFENRKSVWDNKKKTKMTSDCKVMENGPVPPPDLPPRFKNKIKESNGYEEKLLVQKRVTISDVNIVQNRFTMPLRQRIALGFVWSVGGLWLDLAEACQWMLCLASDCLGCGLGELLKLLVCLEELVLAVALFAPAGLIASGALWLSITCTSLHKLFLG